MPPLREMREDLGALILYLLYKHRHGTQTYKLSPKAQALLHYSYPATSANSKTSSNAPSP